MLVVGLNWRVVRAPFSPTHGGPDETLSFYWLGYPWTVLRHGGGGCKRPTAPARSLRHQHSRLAGHAQRSAAAAAAGDRGGAAGRLAVAQPAGPRGRTDGL